ncbi:class I adenylate-forming enzyme family protein [Oceanobacillus sp. Castelsardo]|uniref:class I adenylate-forming enzyme family protein n=1 Tax=Oceanobacillus sp. Castelsardo TaxID=1851204 RepID=UPI000838C045|nr:AMP-binding protein [Oceanobacillus sp. Castelsardo]
MDSLTSQQLMFNGINRFDHQPAITCLETNETITYKELRNKVDRIAGYLYEAGANVGTNIAVLIPNSIESVLFGRAVGRCGATLIPLNNKLGVREVDFILNNAEPEIVVMATEKHIEPVLHYLNENEGKIVIGLPGLITTDYPAEFRIFDWNHTPDAPIEFPTARPDDLSRIAYTGGTTGTPKGVMHTQKSGVAEMEAACMEYPYDDRDKVLFCTPVVHSAGVLLNRSLLAGCHVYLSRSFNPAKFLQTVQDFGITSTFVVPTIIYRLIDEAKKTNYDVSSLRNINYGSSPISTERLKEAFEIFGPILRQQYGMTECSILITRLTKSDHLWAFNHKPDVLRSCGKPCLMTQIRLVDNDGNSNKSVRRGEIVVKAPYVSNGYYKREDLTKEAFRNGWFYTGDVGELDEYGFLHIVERKKDMIISGGQNVYSVEVERVINQHPAVSMSACIGIPHSDWGEAVCVFVVLREGDTCSKEELIQFCKERTSAYMIPKEIYFETSLPLTTVGKIDKKKLKKPFWEGAEREVH